jgi:predicted flavoprotein YhiN
VRNVLAAFGVAATIEWFASLGVALKREETGKLFPVSDKAATVVDALSSIAAARSASRYSPTSAQPT